MSAPANWVIPRELRAATEGAMRSWSIEHPFRRKPVDLTPDEELREYAWALHNIPPEQIGFVSENVLQRSSGHWPRLQQVRDEARSFLKRQADRIGVTAVPDRPMAPDPVADAQQAQCVCMLRALGMDGPDVSRANQMHNIAAVTDAIVTRLRRAITEGRLPAARMEEFRNGEWPTMPELDRIVRDIAKTGEMALSTKAAEMMAGVP